MEGCVKEEKQKRIESEKLKVKFVTFPSK